MTLTDPTGLWTADGHLLLTYDAMVDDDFFSGDDMRVVEASNLNVDRISNQKNNYQHYLPGTTAQAEGFISDRLDEAVNQEMAGNHKGAMQALGSGMHTVQDHYAHEEQGAGWLAHRPIVGTDPDNRLKHPDEFATAGAATRLYRARYKAALKKRKAEQNQQQAKKKDKRKQKPLSNSSTNCGAENSGAECSGGLK